MARNKTPIVEGLLGYKMREDVARYLEQVNKSLGSSEKLVYRKKDLDSPAPQVVVGETADISWVSVEVPDNAGDVVLIDGIDKSQFDLRPVALWNHDWDIPAIGKWAWTKVDTHPCGAKGLLGKLIYDQDDFSQLLYAKSEQGSILGRSIGFFTSPAWIRQATEEEAAKWEGVGDVITKSFLNEITVCNLQCNPLALVDKEAVEAAPIALPVPPVEEKALAPVEKKTIVIKKRLTQRDYDRIYMEELRRIDVEAIVKREIQKLR